MSKYETLQVWQTKVNEIHKELKALRKLNPSMENAKRILELEKVIREMTAAIRLYRKSNGFAA